MPQTLAETLSSSELPKELKEILECLVEDLEEVEDCFPDGCECGLTIEHIGPKMQEKDIKYRLLMVGSALEKME